MCHLILLLPLFGLAVFWIWPLPAALPVYLVLLTVSAFVYIALLKAMQQPVTTKREGLIGETGKVTDIKNHEGHLMVHGEIWAFGASDNLKAGDPAIITGLRGLKLNVKGTGEGKGYLSIITTSNRNLR